MTTKELLENRTTISLTWSEPWPVGGEGHVNVEHRVNVADAIALASFTLAKTDWPVPTDEDLLHEFLVVHWAHTVDEKTCAWDFNGDTETYRTECGKNFISHDDDPFMPFCCFCGNKILEI